MMSIITISSLVLEADKNGACLSEKLPVTADAPGMQTSIVLDPVIESVIIRSFISIVKHATKGIPSTKFLVEPNKDHLRLAAGDQSRGLDLASSSQDNASIHVSSRRPHKTTSFSKECSSNHAMGGGCTCA